MAALQSSRLFLFLFLSLFLAAMAAPTTSQGSSPRYTDAHHSQPLSAFSAPHKTHSDERSERTTSTGRPVRSVNFYGGGSINGERDSATAAPHNSQHLLHLDHDSSHHERVPLLGEPEELSPEQGLLEGAAKRGEGRPSRPSLFGRLSRTRELGLSALRRRKETSRRRRNASLRMTHLDRMTLSPLVKYRRFGRVPVKFLLALGVVIALTSFYVTKNMQVAGYLDGTTDALRHVLGNEATSGAGLTPKGGTVLYTADKLRTHMLSAVTGYFNFPNASITYYHVRPRVSLVWTNSSGEYSAELTPAAPLGPLANRTGRVLSQWLQQHRSLVLHFYLVSHQYKVKDHGTLMNARYGWRCRGVYVFRGHVAEHG